MSDTTKSLTVIPASPAPPPLSKTKKQKLKQALEEAKLYEALGSKILKVKTRTYHALGQHADKLGLRLVGHGRILVAGENAETAFQNCLDLIEAHATSGKEGSDIRVIQLMELLGMFNKQILESGEAHIRADKQPNTAPTAKGTHMSFPRGKVVGMVVKDDPESVGQPG